MAVRNDERGVSMSTQLVLIFPALFALLLVALQWSLQLWADATALAAAQEGARRAAEYTGSQADGAAAARQALRNGAVEEASVTVERTGVEVTVRVTGRPMSVVPLWQGSVSQSVRTPVERLTRP